MEDLKTECEMKWKNLKNRLINQENSQKGKPENILHITFLFCFIIDTHFTRI
jgi:hypothetical protein